MYKQFFISGIGTDVGKTVASAVLVQALKANYWKPVQAGNLDFTDSDFIRKYTDFGYLVLDEAIQLQTSASPNIAAKIDSKNIIFHHFKSKEVNNNFIVEGAGGLLVPIDEKYLIVDLIKLLQLSVIVVVKDYLGCINHTLLSIEALKARDIPIVGLITSGSFQNSVRETLLNFSGLQEICHITHADRMSKEFIKEQASILNLNAL